jgi:hypothetical protein
MPHLHPAYYKSLSFDVLAYVQYPKDNEAAAKPE